MCNWFKKIFGCKCECQKNQEEVTKTTPQEIKKESSQVNSQTDNSARIQ